MYRSDLHPKVGMECNSEIILGVCGFYGLGEGIWEELWQILKMYNVGGNC